MAGLIERRADDHTLLRLVKQLDMRRYRPAGAKVIHTRVEHAAARTGMLKADKVLLPAVRNVARGGGLGHTELAERHEAHGTVGDLPSVFKVQQGDRVKPHVAVVVHGEGEGEAAVVDEVVIPFLDAELAGLYIGAAVDGEELLCVAGLGEVSAAVEQRDAFGDLVLH